MVGSFNHGILRIDAQASLLVRAKNEFVRRSASHHSIDSRRRGVASGVKIIWKVFLVQTLADAPVALTCHDGVSSHSTKACSAFGAWAALPLVNVIGAKVVQPKIGVAVFRSVKCVCWNAPLSSSVNAVVVLLNTNVADEVLQTKWLGGIVVGCLQLYDGFALAWCQRVAAVKR